MGTETWTLPSELHEIFGAGSVPVRLVSLDTIDPDFRPVRFGEHDGRIEMFARLLASASDEVPPVILIDGNERGLIADGWHRILGSLKLGSGQVRAVVLPPAPGMSGEQTARLVGARLTARASQPLTKAERKELALALAEDHPDWSDRQVARESGLDHKTVGKLRRQRSDHDVAPDDEDEVGEVPHAPPEIEQAVRQLDRFVAKLRDAAVFDNVTKFRKGTARRLAAALRHRYGDQAPTVASVISQYFADAATAAEE